MTDPLARRRLCAVIEAADDDLRDAEFFLRGTPALELDPRASLRNVISYALAALTRFRPDKNELRGVCHDLETLRSSLRPRLDVLAADVERLIGDAEDDAVAPTTPAHRAERRSAG